MSQLLRLAVALPFAMLSACSARSGATVDATAPQGWSLVWSDEFEGEGLPDPSRWTYEEGFIRNQESQYYTRARPENARVEDGALIIEARRERFADEAEYTSASLTTRGIASWRYGRIEVRAKLPTGRGMWPAIWMLGENIDEVGWPASGEIDIMENVGREPNTVHGTIHGPGYSGGGGITGSRTIGQPLADTFHTYRVDWEPNIIRWYLDGSEFFRVDPSRLAFQISEQIASEYLADTTELATSLRKLGFRCAIEHFGTGRDPQRLISHLPLDFIKIDGTLMQGLAVDQALQERVKELVDEAKARNMGTIAERVEDANTMAVLWQLGIEFIQGYFVNEPEQVVMG